MTGLTIDLYTGLGIELAVVISVVLVVVKIVAAGDNCWPEPDDVVVTVGRCCGSRRHVFEIAVVVVVVVGLARVVSQGMGAWRGLAGWVLAVHDAAIRYPAWKFVCTESLCNVPKPWPRQTEWQHSV